MSEATRADLEAAGFRVGDAADFLEMSESERAELEARLREYKDGMGRVPRALPAAPRGGGDPHVGSESSLPKR